MLVATAPSSANDDLSLLTRAAKGDSAAVLALYDRHASVLLALAMRVLGSRDEAEEVLQDSFVKIWQEAATYDASRAGFRAWACTIVRNRALDVLRRRGTAAKTKAETAAEPPAPPSESMPDVRAAEVENATRVRAAMAALPEAQRHALELAFFEGLTHVEIAEKTNAPLGTVKTRILDGMRKLKSALGDLR